MAVVVVIVAALVAALVIAAIWTLIMARRKAPAEERQPPLLIYPVGPPARASLSRAASAPARGEPPPRPTSTSRPRPSPVARASDEEEEPGVGSTIQFHRPVDHALQLLPGRLEVLAGERRHKEIRLMRVPGEHPEIVLGRERIESPGHVALQSSTVSRRHARLAYVDGVWTVANLSRTNPVIVNDEALPADHERTLADGDCLELGEVILRFHAR